ncbi:hypothetical protein [Arenimonas sp.]|uniref:hypothetical protein n=1 Tax=Arenimonas sp. TaxID=1872635 RepID=UPI0039E3BFEC
MEKIPPRPSAWTRRAFLVAAGLAGLSATAWFRSRRTDTATDSGEAAAAGDSHPRLPAGSDAGVPVFYMPAYVGAAHAFETTRKARWVADSLQQAPIEGVWLTEHAALQASDVLGVHSPEYVEAVRTGEPRALAQSQGFAWDAGLWPMVLASNGGVVAAARAARQHGVAGALASGLHHARREHGAGFCTFNGLAIAAQALRAEGVRRILILDLDAHCGGGTHSLIAGIDGLRQLDIAVDAFDQYDPAAGNTLDLLGSAAEYLPTLRNRLAALADSEFDLCLYNAGMDPHQDCPVGGLAGVDERLIAQRERIVFDWCRQRRLPVAFVLAGGYIGPGLGVEGLVGLHRLTLEAAAGRPPRA